jgi:periplasmic protein CpxP/Spy
MKSKILLSAVLLLFATFSFAQAQGDAKKMTVDEKVKKTMSQLTPQLALDNDQQTKMQAIYTDFYTAKEKLYEGLQPSAQPDKAQKEKLMNERDEKIKAVLSEDQYKKYKDWEEQMMKQKKDKPGS